MRGVPVRRLSRQQEQFPDWSGVRGNMRIARAPEAVGSVSRAGNSVGKVPMRSCLSTNLPNQLSKVFKNIAG
jgi:hypothetical protein